jgi:hypothetical protein
MHELNVCEIEEVNGGIVGAIGFVVIVAYTAYMVYYK